tara:strand:- start:172 stop:456 length:285 start_codon:yes stop_codon:yes gene_type:complete
VYLLAIDGREDDGAYAVSNTQGEKVLYLFEEEDDATRYAIMLEDTGYPEMHVIEVDDNSAVHVCESHGYRYTIIGEDDIVVPPDELDYDLLSKG